MLGALSQHILNLLFLAGMTLVAIGLGRLILCGSGTKFISFGEYVLFSTGLGFGILSYLTFVLGAFQVLYPAAVYFLLCLCALLSLIGWHSFRSPIEIERRPPFETQLSFWNRCICTLLVACLFLGLLLVLTPAIGKDALIYHLAVPKLFLKYHGICFVPGNIFASYPLNRISATYKD
ncbi:MAG TPA: hypothetical protein EYP79_04270 [Campylobacterales bacterium]|nr:hypothetical protein [Campylobacterales bacterium]